MTSNDTTILDETECWDLLRAAMVGRLAVDIAGQPDIFPINHLVDGETLVFRSAAGTKLAGAVLNGHVAFEIDGYEPEQRTAWSVVVKGTAATIERMQEVFDAEDLPLFPWLASPKPNFVRIHPTSVTGRRFHIIDEVTPDSSIGWRGSDEHQGDEHQGDEGLAVMPMPGAEFHPGAPFLHPD